MTGVPKGRLGDPRRRRRGPQVDVNDTLRVDPLVGTPVVHPGVSCPLGRRRGCHCPRHPHPWVLARHHGSPVGDMRESPTWGPWNLVTSRDPGRAEGDPSSARGRRGAGRRRALAGQTFPRNLGEECHGILREIVPGPGVQKFRFRGAPGRQGGKSFGSPDRRHVLDRFWPVVGEIHGIQ